jgi:protein SCO1
MAHMSGALTARPGGGLLRGVALAALLLAAANGAAAHGPTAPESTVDPVLLQIDEPRFLGAPLRRDLRLIDAAGAEFSLDDMLGKPVILLFSYYDCDGACPVINRALSRALSEVERFRVGRDYRVLTVSFDKRDTPQSAEHFAATTGVPAEMRGGWRFAVFEHQADVDAFTESVGFRFFWSDAAKAFLHPNALVFLTPEGRIARYLYGTAPSAKTIEFALIDADWNRIANSAAVFDILTGVCYSYNFADGSYRFNYSLLAGAGSLLFGISLIALGAIAYRRKIRRASHAG